MNRDLWIAALLFISFALTLATKALPLSPDIIPYMTYASALIDAALTIFFGYTGVKAVRAARNGNSTKTVKK